MSIVIVGDVHCKLSEFQEIIDSYSKDLIIQCGDMGEGFTFIPSFPDYVSWIRGNHDSPSESRQHKNYLGDYGFIPSWNLFYLAGAWSIDHEWRKAWNNAHYPRKVWWEDEELPYEELATAIELYKQTKPEIVVTHEAPASIVPSLLARNILKFDINSPMYNPMHNDFHRPEKLECIKTRTSQALQNMLDNWRPKWWVFGHYHISKEMDTGSTLFKCCAELEPFTIPGT